LERNKWLDTLQYATLLPEQYHQMN
jgi:hypothetical protein